MWWLVRCQPWRVLRGSLIGTAWMVGLAVRPYLIARAIDDGLRPGDHGKLLAWVAAIVVAGVALAYLGIMRHRTMTFVREDATARSAGVLLRHLSQIGSVLPRRLAAGEVATVGGADIGHVSQVLTVTGPGVGAVLAYVVVATLLWAVSPLLALCVLLGVPACAATVGPLLRRLERVESAYRRRQGALTARAGDIVAGLRVLAGVGGRGRFARRYVTQSRELLAEGYRVGAVSSWIDSLTVAVPGLFLAAVVWLAARMAAAGDITVGQLVAVYGYVAVLIVPVWFFMASSYDLIRGRVAARRIVDLLKVTPDGYREALDDARPASDGAHPASDGARSAPDDDHPAPAGNGRAAPAGNGRAAARRTGPGLRTIPGAAELHDPATGLTVPAGRMTGVAADDPAGAVALADRLGRYVVSDVTWGGVPLVALDLAEVRRRILVADHESYLFAGALREILRIRDGLGDAELQAALHAASAEDVVAALPAGLDTPIPTRARTLSGGQRQRVRLARAMLVEAEVLILIEPTSAVDAHTEARIADRLRAARAGRTTVLVTTSPLLLGYADTVAYLRAGRIVATGGHAELLAAEPGYRALVARGADPDDRDFPADMAGALR